MSSKIISILALLCITASSAWGQHQPEGGFDGCAGAHGSFLINGWAYDPDQPNDATTVHVYVFKDKDGDLTPSNTNSNVQATYIVNANQYRGDLVTAGKGNGYHGFDDTYLAVSKGTYYVGIWGIDLSGDNPKQIVSNQDKGLREITVEDPYAVTYNANEGTGSVASQDKLTGIDLELSNGSGLTRTGYTLDGWATSAGGDKAYDLGATYTDNAALSLYAHWTKNEVTLTDGVNLSASGLTGFVGKQCDVSYTRTFNVGKTSTVCLPFAYTKQGTEGSFYEFTSITEEGGEYVATMTEPVSTTLAANTPYLFTPAVSSVTFTGTIASVPATFTAGETVKTDWTFKGTFSTINWDGTQTGTYGFSAQNVGENISQGEFVKVGEYVRIKPMRCYLEYTGSDANWAAARGMNRAAAADEPLPETIKVRLIGANGEVTAIGTLHTQTGEVVLDGWYTLDGTRLSGQPTRKGIYVNNGKKVIIK